MFINYSLEKLTDEEIDLKIIQLQKIVFSTNQNLSLQARGILEDYQTEQSIRADKKFQDYANTANLKIDEVINIG